MRWRKLGLIARGEDLPPGLTHLMLPTPVVLGDLIRIYFVSLDRDGRGRPFFIEVAAADPTRILRGPVGPVLELGERGAFDRDGVVATAIVCGPGDWRMYYTGFERGTDNPYRLLSGVAMSTDEGRTFVRYSHTPVLERSDSERLFRCAPFVWRDGDRYRMYYIAGSAWTDVAGKPSPVYDLRVTESADGFHWPTAGELSLGLTDPDEHGFGRPWVMHDRDCTRLYFSVRKRSAAAYRLGYAEARPDGGWQRDDTAAIQPSTSGWDARAVMYSAVVDAAGRRWCFYNGNDFGRDGLGAAVLESD